MPADRPPRGPRGRRHADPFDERRGRLERLWGLVLRRFRDAAEEPPDSPEDHSKENHDQP